MKYIVLYDDPYDRPTFGETEHPYEFLAICVADKRLTQKQAGAARIVAITDDVPLDRAALVKAVEWERLIERARLDPNAILRLIAKKKLSSDQLEELRDALRRRSMSKDDDFDPPWPARSRSSL